jgi:hypothetical protein
MKNYSRKTNRNVTRYRTPSTFRVRAAMAVQKNRLIGYAPDRRPAKFFNEAKPGEGGD